ncbi:HNH endonuclease family protein [Bacteroides fragilis]
MGTFWTSIYTNDGGFCEEEAAKYIQCLLAYPNEYWKYPISVFYHRNKTLSSEDFKKAFTPYLKKLMSFMLVRFIESPMVNAVKQYVFNFCVDTWRNGEIDCAGYQIPNDFKTRINAFSSSRITKSLLLLNAYLFDDKQTLIIGKSEIEHIFPQSWQDTNYNGWEKSDAETHLNMLGNKIIFEKRLNIQAGNNYFGKKKDRYKESKILEVQSLSKLSQNDWLKDDIERRNIRIIERLYDFFMSSLPVDSNEDITLLFELKVGEEIFQLYQIVDNDTGGVFYRLNKHIYDMNNTDIFNKKMIDESDVYSDLFMALQSIDKKAFISGNLNLTDDKFQNDILNYIRS